MCCKIDTPPAGSGCEGCCHYSGCGYFDDHDLRKSDQEKFEEYCVGCCCGDSFECNRANDAGCMTLYSRTSLNKCFYNS